MLPNITYTEYQIYLFYINVSLLGFLQITSVIKITSKITRVILITEVIANNK